MVDATAPLPPRASPASRKPARIGPSQSTKLFVLDTNVLMHDPTSLFRFEEHDIYLPMMTLEELDDHKKGMTEVARNARQARRFLDEIVSRTPSRDDGIEHGIPLAARSRAAPRPGACSCRRRRSTTTLPASLANGKADNQIIGVVHAPVAASIRSGSVILVSKDINMRIKARALGLAAEDYFNDKVLEDTDLLYTGMRELPADFWDKHGKDMESGRRTATPLPREGPAVPALLVNEFVYQEGDAPFYAIVKEIRGKTAVL